MSRWREIFKVHPAADAFPMMSDAELEELGADIKAHGLRVPIVADYSDDGDAILLDGRNRLEAMERVGMSYKPGDSEVFDGRMDAVGFIISANIRRRHLTKQQQADLIVAAVKAAEALENKLVQVEPVSPARRGGRGRLNKIRQVARDIALEQFGISESTVKRSLAKQASPRATRAPEPYEQPTEHPNAPPKLRAKARRQRKRETLQHYHQLLAQLPRTVEGVRRFYLEVVAKLNVDPVTEMTAVVDGLQRIADKQAKSNGRVEANA
jgi:ParB/Sulfiredoxin domain